MHNGEAITNLLGTTAFKGSNSELQHSSTWDGNTSSLPAELVLALKTVRGTPRRGALSSHITLEGLTYSVKSQHAGNSQVMLETGVDSKPHPAIICYIVQVEHAEEVATYVAVQRFKCHRVAQDPFAQYPLLHMSICDTEPGPLEIVTPATISCHFSRLNAVWEGQPVSIITSLSRA